MFAFRRMLAPPNPVEQPLEVVEMRVHPGARSAEDRARVSMTKVANNTDFLPAGGRHLMHLNWRPVHDLEDLPASVREFMPREAPGMASLPPTLGAALEELGLKQASDVGVDVKKSDEL